MNLNPYKSPYALWAEKTGLITPEDISDVEAVWWGTNMEDLVAKRFCMKTGKKVKRSAYEFACEEYPFLVAHVDRLVVKEPAVLECKTTSSWNKWDYNCGEVPPAHYCQLMFYLHMTGMTTGYLATKRDNQFYINTIAKDYEFIDLMMEKCIEFWHLVETKTPPEIDGSESTAKALAQVYDQSDPEEEVSLAGFEDKLDALDTIKFNVGQMESLKREYENQIKEFMKTATRGTSDHYVVTWRPTKNGNRTFRVIKKGQ
jgi:putative phage-type endonuclease